MSILANAAVWCDRFASRAIIFDLRPSRNLYLLSGRVWGSLQGGITSGRHCVS